MARPWTTAALLLAVSVIGANALALSPVLPEVAGDLAASPAAIARVVAAYGGATALSALFLGGLADRWGARRALLASGALLAAAALASALSPDWRVLALAQAAAGLAAGVMLPAIYAVASATGGARMLGRALTGWSLSLVVGVPAAAVIAELSSWRTSYALLALLAAASLLGVAKLERAAPAARRPAAPWSLARRPGLSRLLCAQAAFMAAFYGLYPFFGDALRGELGVSASLAGAAVLAYGLGFGAAQIGDGAIDRIGASRAAPASLAVVALAYLALARGIETYPSALAAAFVWGFANHLALNAMILRLGALGGANRAAALGLNSAATYFGAMIGPLATGPIYAGSGFVAAAATSALLGAIAVLLALPRAAARAPEPT